MTLQVRHPMESAEVEIVELLNCFIVELSQEARLFAAEFNF
jgi:hypothetical protein